MSAHVVQHHQLRGSERSTYFAFYLNTFHISPFLFPFFLRLSSSGISNSPKPFHANVVPTASDLSVTIDNQIPREDMHIIWRAPQHKDSSPKLSDLLPFRNRNVLPEAPIFQRGSRGRRHANSGSARGHGQLMRVGCVLGTCQVQNLSHRLYQLIGQSGREDYSPINPRSPHSYG